MNIILHIGLGKTGTSSIQASLVENSKFLRNEHGLLYPNDRFGDFLRNNHNFFLGCLFKMEKFSTNPQCLRRGLTLEKLQARQPIVMEKFQKEVARDGCDTLILSAEGITNWNSGQIGALKAWLETFSENITVLGCLRHPRNYLSSWAQQAVKNGSSLSRLKYRCDLSTRCLSYHLDHYDRSNIRVFDFGEAILNKNGVVSEFYNQLGVELDSLPNRHEFRTNESMSHEATVALSKFNEVHYQSSLLQIKKYFSRLELMKLPGSKFQLPPEIYEEKEGAIQKEVDWVKSNFGLVMIDPMEKKSIQGS